MAQDGRLIATVYRFDFDELLKTSIFVGFVAALQRAAWALRDLFVKLGETDHGFKGAFAEFAESLNSALYNSGVGPSGKRPQE